MCLLVIKCIAEQIPPHMHTPCGAMTAMALKLDRLCVSLRGNNLFQRFHEPDFKDLYQNVLVIKSLKFP